MSSSCAICLTRLPTNLVILLPGTPNSCCCCGHCCCLHPCSVPPWIWTHTSLSISVPVCACMLQLYLNPPSLLSQVDESQTGEPGWLGGELRGRTGWFPANYAERIPDSEAPISLRATASATPTSAQQPMTTPPPAPGHTSSSTSSANSNWADFSTT